MHNFKKLKSPLWALTMLLTAASSLFVANPLKVFAQTTGSLVLNNFQVPPGGTITVPLQVNLSGGDIGAFSVTLTYDKSVVNIANDTDIAIDPNFSRPSTTVANASANTSTLSGSGAAPGLSGTVTLANVTFTAVGTAGATTTVVATADPGTFVDSTATPFASDPTAVTSNVSIIDTVPDAFTLNAVTGAPVNTLETSNTITVTGINAPTPISISGNGGQYSIGGAPYTSAAGTVNNNETVTVQQTSSASFSTPVTTTLTIGGITADFTVTTAAIDIVPDAFTFTAQTNVPVSSLRTSNTITVSGINSPSPISIAGNGGQYSINGGAYTSAAGTVSNGNTVTVQQTSSANFSTATTTTLTIDGVNADFTVTTSAQPVVNVAPVLQAIGTLNAVVSTPFTFTAHATDANNDTLTFSLSNAPTGADINANTGVFTWTPTTIGTFTFNVIVSDGSLTDTKSVTINVTATPVVSERGRGDNDSRCNTQDCKKFRSYRSRYKNENSREIYWQVKALKESNPREFQRLENIYMQYKSLSSSEREAQLSPKVLADFFKFKNYNGYRHYKELKEKI